VGFVGDDDGARGALGGQVVGDGGQVASENRPAIVARPSAASTFSVPSSLKSGGTTIPAARPTSRYHMDYLHAMSNVRQQAAHRTGESEW
jgi:hypothetical protein